MPRKTTIEFIKVGKSFRIIIPRDIRGAVGQKTVWFQSKEAAKNKCAELMNLRGEIGSRFHRLNKVAQAKVIQSIDLAGSADRLLEIVQTAIETHPEEVATLKELAIRCVAAKERSGKTAKHCKNLERNLKAFIEGREDQLAHVIQPNHVEQWVNSKPHWSQFTKQSYLKDVAAMFSFGVKNGFCKTNPAAKVERPAMADNPPTILSVDECERLMNAAAKHDPALVQYLAFCLFGGLRPSEAAKIRRENVLENHLEVYGKKTRARNRRLVTINPTLRAWVEKFKDAKWKSHRRKKEYGPFDLVNLQKRLLAVRKATAENGKPEINWSQDCLRHTFVSMHFAIHGAAKTAMEAGHSENVLFKHYREIVTKEEAEKFWRIMPI